MPHLKKPFPLKDVLVLSAFPVLITLVMFLPQAMQDAMKLNLRNPSWWQLLTSGFVHNSLSHYFDNLIAFLLLLLLQIIIVYKMNWKKEYFMLLFFTIISFPVVSSIVKLLWYPGIMPIVSVSCGSSGIISAMIGFIPVLWVAYISKISGKKLLGFSFFSTVLAYIVLSFAIIYFHYHRDIMLMLVIITMVCVFAFAYRDNLRHIYRAIIRESNIFMLFYLLFLLLFFLASPLLTFPLKLVQGNSSVDFFAHYLGFIYGFFISFVFFRQNNPNV